MSRNNRGSYYVAAGRRSPTSLPEEIPSASTDPPKVIPLTRGYIAIVDSKDYERIAAFNWHAKLGGKRVYAARNVQKADGRWTILLMHRDVLGLSDPEIQIDHKRHYSWGIDNRRENIRVCTASQNAANREARIDNTSGFTGVSWSNKRNMWRANAMINQKWTTVGFFATKEEAAVARDKATAMSYGDFALLNKAS